MNAQIFDFHSAVSPGFISCFLALAKYKQLRFFNSVFLLTRKSSRACSEGQANALELFIWIEHIL